MKTRLMFVFLSLSLLLNIGLGIGWYRYAKNPQKPVGLRSLATGYILNANFYLQKYKKTKVNPIFKKPLGD